MSAGWAVAQSYSAPCRQGCVAPHGFQARTAQVRLRQSRDRHASCHVNWLGYAATLVVGVVAGVVGEVFLTRPILRARQRVERVWSRTSLGQGLARLKVDQDIMGYQPGPDGLFELWEWSPDGSDPRLLDERRHRMKLAPPPEQTWVNSDLLARAQKEWRKRHARNQGGQYPDAPTVAYVTSFTQDHGEALGEGRVANRFDVSVAPAFYSDAEAAGSCFDSKADLERLRKILTTGNPLDRLASIPPCRASVEVALVSKQRRFLAILRSTSVASSPGVWTVGPNETLTPPPAVYSPGAKHESLFTLAERCLQEEIGLSRAEFGPMRFSWFGFSIPALIADGESTPPSHSPGADSTDPTGRGIFQCFFAQTACFLDEEQVRMRIANAHSNFEAQDSEWLSLSKSQVKLILEGRDGRKWAPFARFGIRELWRFKELLFTDLEDHALTVSI